MENKTKTIKETVDFMQKNKKLLGWRGSDGGCDIFRDDNGLAITFNYNDKDIDKRKALRIAKIFKKFFNAKKIEIMTKRWTERPFIYLLLERTKKLNSEGKFFSSQP